MAFKIIPALVLTASFAVASILLANAQTSPGTIYTYTTPCKSGELADPNGTYCYATAVRPPLFYFASSGNDTAGDGSQAHPWQSSAPLAGKTFGPDSGIRINYGDTIEWCYGWDWGPGGNATATIANPITVDGYGDTSLGRWHLHASSTCPNNGRRGMVTVKSPKGLIVWNGGGLFGNNGQTPVGISLENNLSTLAPGGVILNDIETGGFWDGVHANDYGADIFYIGYPGNGIQTLSINGWQCHGLSGVTSRDDGCLNGFGNGKAGTDTSKFLQQVNITNFRGWNKGGGSSVVAGQSGNCLQFNGMTNVMLDHSVCHDIAASRGTCGDAYPFWTSNVFKVTFSYLETYRVTGARPPAGCDKGGIDFDIDTIHASLDHSNIHDSDGPGLLIYDGGAPHDWTAYDNIFANTANVAGDQVAWQFAQAASTGKLINNTIYGRPISIGTPQPGGCASLVAANNLSIASGGANGVVQFAYLQKLCANQTFTHNGYASTVSGSPWLRIDPLQCTTWTCWQASIAGGDAGAVLSLNVSPIVGPTNQINCTDENSPTSGYAPPCPAGFSLKSGSPFHGVGIDPATFGLTIATDYYGAPYARSIGAAN